MDSLSITSLLDRALWLVLCLTVHLTLYSVGGTVTQVNIDYDIVEEDDEALRRYDAEFIDCQNISEIVFLGFFPCLRQNGRSAELLPSESIRDCDLLAEAAAQLAVERVNADPDILPNITLTLYPIYVPSNRESQADGGYYDVLVQIIDLLHSNYSDSVWGVIGPGDDPRVADFIAPMNENAGLMTVSYGSTTKGHADEISTFYRTLPSDKTTNYGRLVLLERHEWFRIGILASSREAIYFNESSQFVSMFNEYVEKGLFNEINLDLTESFESSPTDALKVMKSRDINIIVGFFGSENARRVLCQAESMGLISADHAWVLPSYYDPDWWKSPSNSTAECSDEKMREILESVIFIDTIKLPPVELKVQNFYSKLLKKTTDLFRNPSLTEEDLKPYLLRSRATSAYDAVTLLARSVGVAFNQSGDSCTDTNLVQACEYCQLHSAFSKCFDLNMPLGCEDCYGTSVTFTPEDIAYLDHHRNGSKPEYLLDFYGQILYSQFQDGEECPIVLWWPGLGEDDYKKAYIPIRDFDEKMTCVSKNVILSRQDFVSNSSKCLKRFDWQGSSSPPSSHYLDVFFIPLGGLIAIGILILIVLLAAILLVIFNLLWRTHKIVKATSPWLNVILLSGIMIRLPATLLHSLSASANHYPGLMGKDLTPLCNIGLWQYYIGDALFVGILIAKNWRIYRIFFNKELKQRGNKLADYMLMVGIALIMVPLVIVLSVWSAIGIEFHANAIPNENLQIINYTTCFPEISKTFEFVTNAYILILYLFLFILSLLTASVPSSTFRREGVATYKVVVLSLLPVPLVFLTRVTVLLSRNPEQFEVLFWIEVCWANVLPLVLLAVLFGPTICAIVRNRVQEKIATSEEKEHRRVTLQYNNLRHKADTLKAQLNQLDSNILRIKADLASRAANSTSSDKSSKAEPTECASDERDVIDGAGTSGNNCKVDLTIVSESPLQNTAKSVAVVDNSKHDHETGEASDSDVNNHHKTSQSALSTGNGSKAEALLANKDLVVINSTTLDGGNFLLSNQTAVSPCSARIETENTRDSEAYDGHIDLCRSLEHRQIKSSESSSSVTTLPMQTTL